MKDPETADNEPMTVLVVEDNQDSRELVTKILRHRGYHVIEASDGEEALKKAAEQRPDLVLLDISLPKLDGYEVTRKLKSQEEFRGIPIVALTAHAMKGDREKALSSGCEGYIPKPINIRELPDQVRHFLGEGKRGQRRGSCLQRTDHGEEKEDTDR